MDIDYSDYSNVSNISDKSQIKEIKPQNLTYYQNYDIEVMRINDIILPALKVNLNKSHNKKSKIKSSGTAHVVLNIKELIGIENTFNKIPLNLVYGEIIDFCKNYPEKCIVESVNFTPSSLS